uniref:Uncharacterized protein n=1 Tax=viral metagenome TaxID=1070528 RepID=A0A6C0ATH8_9ZZZZ
MSWLGFGQATAASAQPTIDNYDMDLKVYVRSGTPLFKLSSINSPGDNNTADSVNAGTAPGTFTDSIMKTFYGNDYNTVAAAPVTTPAPSADAVTVTPPASVTTASSTPASVTLVNEQISVLDKKIAELNGRINRYPKNLTGKDASEKGVLVNERQKLNQEKVSLLNLLTPTKKGGRRTRHVRKGKHARKSHRNRKHTKRYFEFF